jgi:hypothetical protein
MKTNFEIKITGEGTKREILFSLADMIDIIKSVYPVGEYEDETLFMEIKEIGD